MDEAGINAKGIAPLKPTLDRIAGLDSKKQLPELLGYLQNNGVQAMFAFGSEPDAKDSMMEIANTDQGGLGLPDRDYYLKTDEKSVALRKAYVAHVAKMFELMGETPDKAAADANTVLKIETQLATRCNGSGGAPRSEQGLPQDDRRSATGAQPRLRLERVSSSPSRRPPSPVWMSRSPTL